MHRETIQRVARALLFVALATPGCRRVADTTATTTSRPSSAAETPAPKAALVAEPVLAGSYDAISTTATGITGDLTLKEDRLDFQLGSTYRTHLASRPPVAQMYAADGSSWADLLSARATTTVELRAVEEEIVSANAPNGGLCRPARVTYIALVSADDASGAPALKLAAFKGSAAPSPTAAAADLCGTFSYAPTRR